jgi:hypothetical protein
MNRTNNDIKRCILEGVEIMKFIEIECAGMRHLINVSTIKSIWENAGGRIGIQLLDDEEGTFYTTDKFTFDGI